jgi:dTDP-N-acetylfucosamine:lipid II N-acetylfucosaminyltransferase
MDAAHLPRAVAMIHHLIAESPYTNRFLRLLHAHPDAFPPDQHLAWVERGAHVAFRVEELPGLARVDVGAWGFVRAFQRMAPGDGVVIHQLTNPRLLLWLALDGRAARRCAWSIWGGDVYYFKVRPRTWLHDFRESLRKAVIPSIPLLSSMIPGDAAVVREVYGSRARYVEAFYPIPMDYATLESRDGARPPHAEPTLLVGNSGDASNAHAEVFHALARFRDRGVRVIAPLSYKGDGVYVQSVVALGRELFGERFTPLTEFLPPEQYARLIRGTDAAIMNHGHQQALGNIIAMLMMGKKVFVRGDATPYRYFRDLGIDLEDTRRLPELGLDEIVDFAPEAGARNAAALRAHLSEENAVAGWKNVFAALRGVSSG